MFSKFKTNTYFLKYNPTTLLELYLYSNITKNKSIFN